MARRGGEDVGSQLNPECEDVVYGCEEREADWQDETGWETEKQASQELQDNSEWEQVDNIDGIHLDFRVSTQIQVLRPTEPRVTLSRKYLLYLVLGRARGLKLDVIRESFEEHYNDRIGETMPAK